MSKAPLELTHEQIEAVWEAYKYHEEIYIPNRSHAEALKFIREENLNVDFVFEEEE